MWDNPAYVEVDRVVFHPLYDHNNFHYDIAVLHLTQPVTDQAPVTLPNAGGKKKFRNEIEWYERSYDNEIEGS